MGEIGQPADVRRTQSDAVNPRQTSRIPVQGGAIVGLRYERPPHADSTRAHLDLEELGGRGPDFAEAFALCAL
jgi:hypothetical protein